ncbi:hypothetical protein SLE2022_072790 [Rubroshorea leprosula]
MDFLDLFILALMPVLKVLLVTAVGLFLATDRVNLLGPDARSHLNSLVFYLFSPALIFSNLADTVTMESLRSLWFMPVNILLTLILGSLLGWILVKITKTPPHLQGLVIGCCSAGNIGNLLLVVLPELCEESNSPFGDSSTCSTNAEAYASFSLAILAVYIWSYVYIMMWMYAKKGEGNGIDKDEHPDPVIVTICGGESEDFLQSSREALLSSKSSEGTEGTSDQIEPLPQSIEGKEKGKVLVFLEKIKQHVNNLTSHIKLKMLLAPSTIAAIVGFTVGLVSPIRKLLIGDSAPLRTIYSSAALIGNAAIPCITLIIGANLLKGLRGYGVGAPMIAGIAAIKFIILPALGVGIVKAANHFGIVESNSLLLFTLLFQYAVPPAMNIGTISQLLGAGQTECSVIMLWTYALATFFLTLWSAFFIWLVT